MLIGRNNVCAVDCFFLLLLIDVVCYEVVMMLHWFVV